MVDATKPLARQTEPLDNTGGSVQASDVGEADDPFVPIAKKAGWVELKDWTRDPKDHVEARTYVEGLPEALREKDERLRRTSQVAEAAAEEARQAGIREATERLKEAHRGGDEEAVVRAARDLAGPPQPLPQTVAWMGRNPWFKTDTNLTGDPEATALAVAVIQTAERRGATVDEALEAGETATRRRFPELFGGRVEKPALTLASVREPPRMAEGSRGITQRAKVEKGWADIPSADRRVYEKAFVKRMVRDGLKLEEAQERLARRYFASSDVARAPA